MLALDVLSGRSGDATRHGLKLVHTRVVDNQDSAGLGRVTVQIPWLNGPVTAAVAVPAAGNGRGVFILPQPGDEVLVLLTEEPSLSAYVIGCLWTSRDPPPRRERDAASHVELVRTPGGHQLELDDRTGVVRIVTSAGQKVELSQDGVEIVGSDGSGGATARLRLTAEGDVSIQGRSISIEAQDSLDLMGSSIGISADGRCAVRGATVAINE